MPLDEQTREMMSEINRLYRRLDIKEIYRAMLTDGPPYVLRVEYPSFNRVDVVFTSSPKIILSPLEPYDDYIR